MSNCVAFELLNYIQKKHEAVNELTGEKERKRKRSKKEINFEFNKSFF